MNEKLTVSFDIYKREIETLNKAILKSKEYENSELFEYLRDSVVQRFEYTTEWAWKIIRVFIEEIEWTKCLWWPKNILKLWFKYWYIGNLEIWFEMSFWRYTNSYWFCRFQQCFRMI